MFAALDWMPTLVEIAGGPKGDGLKKQIEAGKYPGIVKTTLDGVDQLDYLTGKSDKSARDSSSTSRARRRRRSATRTGRCTTRCRSPAPDGWIMPLVPFHFTLVQNIKRDPFEQAVGHRRRSRRMSIGGALAAPMTAFQYDWNMLPIGQQLWMKWFETLKEFPPLQAPASYNLTQVMDQIKDGGRARASD